MEMTLDEILEIENCPTCKKYEGKFAPSHFASTTCESFGKKLTTAGGGGHRVHCTCESCF